MFSYFPIRSCIFHFASWIDAIKATREPKSGFIDVLVRMTLKSSVNKSLQKAKKLEGSVLPLNSDVVGLYLYLRS